MKTKTAFLIISTVMLSIIIIPFGCKKDSNDPEIMKHVWAVGNADSTNYPLIYYSDNGGENWVRQGEGQAALLGIDLSDVWSVDENIVWAISNGNDILKTTDGGTTWNSVQPPSNHSDIRLSSISVIGKTNIWISGSPGIIYNSTDGGNNWLTMQSPVLANSRLQGIHAVTSDIIYAAGGKNGLGFIVYTTDGGQTWDSLVPANDFNKSGWIGVTSSDPNNIVLYGGKSLYIHSNDGGQSWKNDSTRIAGGTGGGGPDINDLTMLDAQTWWAAMDYDNIGLTTNAGSSPWVNQGPAPVPGGMWLVGIDYYDNDLCIIVGSSSDSFIGKIIKTSDGGQLWELCIQTDAWMNKVSFIK